MPEVTFIIPVGPAHTEIAERAIASVKAQTVEADYLVVLDENGRGAGAARNYGIQQAETPFIVFLDADDEVAPTFAERTLTAFNGRYIYTDLWRDNGEYIAAPACPWVNESWHAVTTLLPLEWAREVGGFDETLPGGEDTDFYMKLGASGYCGQRLGEPLFIYHSDSGDSRSDRWKRSERYHADRRMLETKYGGRNVSNCGGCGDGNIGTPNAPMNEYVEGDVEVIADWSGNYPFVGATTGRLYRMGNFHHFWINPADMEQFPRRHKLIAAGATQTEAQTADWQQFGERLAKHVAPTVKQSVSAPVSASPDTKTVIERWGVKNPASLISQEIQPGFVTMPTPDLSEERIPRFKLDDAVEPEKSSMTAAEVKASKAETPKSAGNRRRK